nr:MAG TPA: Protein of unknown function (DUF1677) [Caudoviricetes sp.]
MAPMISLTASSSVAGVIINRGLPPSRKNRGTRWLPCGLCLEIKRFWL